VNDPGRAAEGAARPPAIPRFPADDEPLYTVGQVADMLGVQPAYLRRLDTHDVVRPSRSTGRQRRYSRIEIDRIGAITTLMGEGMTLAGAHRIIELQAEIDELRRQLADLRKRATEPR
jgi:MerR family transcriptional regulator/heat shock protein HspR